MNTAPATRGTVLLLGNYRPAVAVARALVGAGYRVILGLEGEDLGAELSGYVAESWDHPQMRTDPDAFGAALTDLLEERDDIVAVLPVAEEFVLFLAANEDFIQARTALVSPAGRTVRLLLDKLEALEFVQELGVATLPYARVTNRDALIDAAESIGFPLTIRAFGAAARLGDRKALIIENREDLDAILPVWPAGHEALLLQRFADGIRHNIYFAARGGEVVDMVESRIIRTDHPEGTGLAVDGETIEPTPALVADLEAIVSATGYTGAGLIQFIVGNNGHCFLELNPRIGGSHAVAENAGLPLAAMAVAVALDEETPESAVKTGQRYAWTGGDLLAAKQAWRRGDISTAGLIRWVARAAGTALAADMHMVWHPLDPMPALHALYYLRPRLRMRERLAAVIAPPHDRLADGT